ncbi:MAG: glucose 1-dehydrogenase [Actinobacteria bacterium]|nr:glucose 1-dehydrogenase [Actinomycetota bacterium]
MHTRELFDLSGRVAVVTGGGTGIGKQMATALAELGADVVLCARKPERCEEAAAELRELGVRALGLRCDVTDEREVRELVERTVGELGRIDVLVNNAGTTWGASPEDMPLAGWQKVVDVNLTGAFLCAQAAGRAMIERGEGGAIVNIASVAGLRGAPVEVMNTIVYHATKGGLIALTRDLAWKWARHRIRVNAIAPGWFPSEMSRVVLERGGDAILGSIPLGRYGGDDDLKGAVALLASRASNFMTGQVVVVDGGQSA